MSVAASESVTIGPVTLAFPHLFQPQVARGSTNAPKYNTAILLTQVQYDQIMPLMMGTVEGAFRNGGSQRPDFKWAIKPCSSKPDHYPVAAQRGMYYMNVSADVEHKPRVVDPNHQDILDPGVVRDGTQAYVSVNFYDFNNQSIGVAAGLGPVMVTGDGEVLNSGGGVGVDQAFAGITPAPAAGGYPTTTPGGPQPNAAPPAGYPQPPQQGVPNVAPQPNAGYPQQGAPNVAPQPNAGYPQPPQPGAPVGAPPGTVPQQPVQQAGPPGTPPQTGAAQPPGTPPGYPPQ